MNRGDLSNEQWERLKPLITPQKPHTGKPSKDHRTVINGIMWILRTGAPWRDMPEHYWQKNGIWNQILESLQAITYVLRTRSANGRASLNADKEGHLVESVHYVDGTVIRAHQQHYGGKKGAKKMKN